MAEQGLNTPLLIWVDDNMGGHVVQALITHARANGVHVRSFYSTIEAKLWILENMGIGFA